MKHSLSLLLLVAFTGCSSLTTYAPGTSTGKDGSIRAVAVKKLQFYGDIHGPFTIGADGSISVKDPSPNAPVARIAVTDSKGNVLRDAAGNPVFNEIPVTASLKNSDATTALFRGMSLFTRSVGSLVGTIGASLFGIEAANQLGGAANTAASAVAP